MFVNIKQNNDEWLINVHKFSYLSDDFKCYAHVTYTQYSNANDKQNSDGIVLCEYNSFNKF